MIMTTESAVQLSRSLLADVLGTYQPRDFAVRFWDGTTWEPAPGSAARFTLVLHHPGALRRMFLPPNDRSLGEAYIFGDFDIEGDFTAVFPVAEYLFNHPLGTRERLQLASQLLRLPPSPSAPRHIAGPNLRGARHTKARDQQAVAYHYNRSNAFYALWLDPLMVYSCAYFQTPTDTLADAQAQKIAMLCRKLRLKPGERLLDIGCGWGGLVISAAQHFGVQAHGITLSQAQAEFAQQRITELGLQDRCTVEFRDYRDLPAVETYDKLVSVGMCEHVGEAQLPAFFQQAWRVLKPGGVFLNHGIATPGHVTQGIQPRSFVDTYVFPDGELVPLFVTLQAAERQHFEVRDVESLREHYALTLQHWVRNLEAHADAAQRMTDAVAYRIWRLYLAGSIWNFQSGNSTIYQMLLAKPQQGHSGLPLTRNDWYA
jgi:cyclopropane-fatty-acyl-phospholipid synthase